MSLKTVYVRANPAYRKRQGGIWRAAYWISLKWHQLMLPTEVIQKLRKDPLVIVSGDEPDDFVAQDDTKRGTMKAPLNNPLMASVLDVTYPEKVREIRRQQEEGDDDDERSPESVEALMAQVAEDRKKEEGKSGDDDVETLEGLLGSEGVDDDNDTDDPAPKTSKDYTLDDLEAHLLTNDVDESFFDDDERVSTRFNSLKEAALK